MTELVIATLECGALLVSTGCSVDNKVVAELVREAVLELTMRGGKDMQV